MNTQKYITAREAEECKKVVAAFNELYNQTDILVINSGEHGFVLLKYDNYMTGYFSTHTSHTKNRHIIGSYATLGI